MSEVRRQMTEVEDRGWEAGKQGGWEVEMVPPKSTPSSVSLIHDGLRLLPALAFQLSSLQAFQHF